MIALTGTLAVLVVQLQRESGCFRGHQSVTDDQPGVALDDRRVRQVLADHLVQTISQLEQSTALSHQSGLAPQTRVDGIRCIAVGEPVGVVREDELPFITFDQSAIDERCHETSRNQFEVEGVAERKVTENLGICQASRFGGGLGVEFGRCSHLLLRSSGTRGDLCRDIGSSSIPTQPSHITRKG